MQPVTSSILTSVALKEDKNLVVKWNDFEVKAVTLGTQILLSGWMPTAVIGIGRGGWEVAAALSRILRISSGAFMCKSYEVDGVCLGTVLKTANDITYVGSLEGPVLVCDDLVERGKTLEATAKFIETHYKIEDVKTAVLFCKTKTEYVPHYFVEEVDSDRWIFLPNEIYERLPLSKLPQEDLIKLSNSPELVAKLLENLPQNPRAKMSIEKMSHLINQ